MNIHSMKIVFFKIMTATIFSIEHVLEITRTDIVDKFYFNSPHCL